MPAPGAKLTGVYLFTHTPTGKRYIGSTMNFQSRVHAHISDSKNPSSKFHKFVYENSWNDFTFGTIYETTNYLTEFKLRYPNYVLSHGEMIILSHLTQLEIRTLEQSLISQFSPELNLLEREVVFSYTTWDSSSLDQSYNTKNPKAQMIEVRLEGIDTILTVYPSIRKAAEGLGVSKALISKYINKSSSFESKLLETSVIVKTPNSTIDHSPIEWSKNTSKQYPPINYDILSLEEGHIYALNADKSVIQYKFNNVQNVIETLYPSKFNNKIGDSRGRYVLCYYNLEKLVKTELGDFYFVIHPNTLVQHKSKSFGTTKPV